MAKQTSTPASRRTSAARGGAGSRRPVASRGKSYQGTELSWGFPLQKQNLIGIGFGVLLIVIGYLCMSTGMVASDQAANNDGVWNSPLAVTIAPILLTLGYCVVIPLSILYRGRREATVVVETPVVE